MLFVYPGGGHNLGSKPHTGASGLDSNRLLIGGDGYNWGKHDTSAAKDVELLALASSEAVLVWVPSVPLLVQALDG